MKSLVTCVIPSLNQGRFIEDAIKSVVNQECFDWVELILMDGGSSDKTLDIVQRYEKHFHTIISASDNGQAAAINEGVKRGQGQYVSWLNSDDILMPEAMRLQVEFLQRNGDKIKAVHGKGLNVSYDGKFISYYPSQRFKRQDLAKGCPVCQPTAMFKRELWEELGGLDEHFQMCMDYDLWWRAVKRTKVGFIPQVLACNRIHKLTKTEVMRQTHYREAYEILKRELGYVPVKWLIDGLFEETVNCFPRQATFNQWRKAIAKAPHFLWRHRKKISMRANSLVSK